MAWVFVRGAERLQCEARNSGWAGDCELVLLLADGTTQVERYPDQAALLRRQFELIRAWKAQGWREIEPDTEIEELSGVRRA
jgi:hypothetical protein